MEFGWVIRKELGWSPEDLGSATELQLSDRGGHVGFIARGNRAWLEQQIARFLLSSD